jgi:hypothetical protein
MGGAGGISVTTTDALGHDAVVWTVSSQGANDLRAFDGDTGQDLLSGHPIPLGDTSKYQAPIAAKGRIFVASNARLWALTVR